MTLSHARRSGLPSCLVFVSILAGGAGAMEMPGADGGRVRYLPLILREAAASGLPPALADAVAMIETGYRPDAVGGAGEIGLMQVMPATARQLGFTGTLAELADPATNIHLGVAYLARAWARAGGDICRALTRYRAGLGQAVTTPLSARYCMRALAWLSATGSRLAGGLPPPNEVGTSPPIDPHVIAIVPALAAQQPMRIDAWLVAGTLPRRTVAERNAARNARFLSHLRHPGPAPATAFADEE